MGFLNQKKIWSSDILEDGSLYLLSGCILDETIRITPYPELACYYSPFEVKKKDVNQLKYVKPVNVNLICEAKENDAINIFIKKYQQSYFPS